MYGGDGTLANPDRPLHCKVNCPTWPKRKYSTSRVYNNTVLRRNWSEVLKLQKRISVFHSNGSRAEEKVVISISRTQTEISKDYVVNFKFFLNAIFDVI